jgi:hypothetical protein
MPVNILYFNFNLNGRMEGRMKGSKEKLHAIFYISQTDEILC